MAALALAIAWLEGEDRARRGRAGWAEVLVYLPLLVPQVAFLYGLNVAFLRAGLSGTMAAVVWAHVLFVFPYVMIALSEPWRRLDRRYPATAAALGAGPGRRLWAVKLPMLLQPILTAAAIGFAVSVAQYLPTLFIGGGTGGDADDGGGGAVVRGGPADRGASRDRAGGAALGGVWRGDDGAAVGLAEPAGDAGGGA